MVKMKISSTDNVNLKTVQKRIKSFKQEFKKEVVVEIKKRLLNPATAEPYITQIISVLSEMQGEYWGGGGLASQEDPTQITAARYAEAVRGEVLKNFASAAKSVDGQAGTVSLVLLSNDFLGIGSEGDRKGNRPIQWLSYFLSGNLDNDLYWVNQEHYEIFKGRSSGDLGRFGVGHMWHVGPEEARKLNAQLKAAGKSYSLEALRHPQSGKAGKDWFGNVWSAVDFYQQVQTPAVNAALERVQSRLFKA
jgi:hypothetical protein